MISKKSKYAIKALVALAREYKSGKLLPSSTISEKENISRKFLEAILLELRNHGYLESKMGTRGGYYILKNPNQIKIIDILRLMDGPVAMISCVSLNFYEPCDDCEDEQSCGIRQVAQEIRDKTIRILSGKTIHDILKSEEKLKKHFL
jgi:Rrf2 family protein